MYEQYLLLLIIIDTLTTAISQTSWFDISFQFFPNFRMVVHLYPRFIVPQGLPAAVCNEYTDNCA